MTDTGNTVSARELLARIVDTCQPKTLVVCGTAAEEIGQLWCSHHREAALTVLRAEQPNDDFPLPQTQDLALITGTLEQLTHDQGELLLGQLRNYGTHQIAVIMANNAEWAFTDFIGLGFQRQATLAEGDPGEDEESLPRYTLYTYNIDSYNHKRQWNNPDNWANPEMWGKAWW